MAKNETRRIRPSQLQDDRDSFAALKVMTGYAPPNSNFTVAKIQISQQTMVDQRDVEAQRQAELDAARVHATGKAVSPLRSRAAMADSQARLRGVRTM